MKDYEALVILRAAGTEQDAAQHAAQIEEHIKKSGGQIINAQSLGRRRLAFRIARQTEGYYHLVRFRAPSEQIGGLDRLLRLNDTVVRFMILSADDIPAAPASAPARGRSVGEPAPTRS